MLLDGHSEDDSAELAAIAALNDGRSWQLQSAALNARLPYALKWKLWWWESLPLFQTNNAPTVDDLSCSLVRHPSLVPWFTDWIETVLHPGGDWLGVLFADQAAAQLGVDSIDHERRLAGKAARDEWHDEVPDYSVVLGGLSRERLVRPGTAAEVYDLALSLHSPLDLGVLCWGAAGGSVAATERLREKVDGLADSGTQGVAELVLGLADEVTGWHTLPATGTRRLALGRAQEFVDASIGGHVTYDEVQDAWTTSLLDVHDHRAVEIGSVIQASGPRLRAHLQHLSEADDTFNDWARARARQAMDTTDLPIAPVVLRDALERTLWDLNRNG
ncbi:hypothetical protein [Microbacterium aoyamense]|nr:hypothetical protein [Microbacterium aoyamense]